METITSQMRTPVKLKTPYQILAEKFDSNERYVGQIARGERVPIRGKGLKILKEIQKITKQQIL